MEQGKTYGTQRLAEEAFRKWFIREFGFSISHRYQNYLNKSHDEIHGYGYGDVLKEVDSCKFSREMGAFYQKLSFDEFCEFMGLDVGTILDSLMKQTNEWSDFELHFVGRERGMYRLWLDGEWVYELRFFTSEEVENNKLVEREAILKQVALFDELLRADNHYTIYNSLREARARLLEKLE
jgi:hypothetical protein